MACDPLLCAPILGGLPSMFKVNVRTDRAGHWLEGSMLLLVDEAASDRAGSDAMLAKVSEALSWTCFAAMWRDCRITRRVGSPALAIPSSARVSQFDSRVDHPWTIAELAEAVGVRERPWWTDSPGICQRRRWRI